MPYWKQKNCAYMESNPTLNINGYQEITFPRKSVIPQSLTQLPRVSHNMQKMKLEQLGKIFKSDNFE